MKLLTALLLLIAASSLSASITLTTPYSVPLPNGSGALVAQSLTTIACESATIDVLHGVANDTCYFCNDTVSGSQDLSCAPIQGVSPFYLQLTQSTCVLTVIYQGQSVGGTTYGATACSSAWTFDTTQSAAAIRNATEKLFLPFNASTNPSGLGIISGGGSQNATWQ